MQPGIGAGIIDYNRHFLRTVRLLQQHRFDPVRSHRHFFCTIGTVENLYSNGVFQCPRLIGEQFPAHVLQSRNRSIPSLMKSRRKVHADKGLIYRLHRPKNMGPVFFITNSDLHRRLPLQTFEQLQPQRRQNRELRHKNVIERQRTVLLFQGFHSPPVHAAQIHQGIFLQPALISMEQTCDFSIPSGISLHFPCQRIDRDFQLFRRDISHFELVEQPGKRRNETREFDYFFKIGNSPVPGAFLHNSVNQNFLFHAADFTQTGQIRSQLVQRQNPGKLPDRRLRQSQFSPGLLQQIRTGQHQRHPGAPAFPTGFLQAADIFPEHRTSQGGAMQNMQNILPLHFSLLCCFDLYNQTPAIGGTHLRQVPR